METAVCMALEVSAWRRLTDQGVPGRHDEKGVPVTAGTPFHRALCTVLKHCQWSDRCIAPGFMSDQTEDDQVHRDDKENEERGRLLCAAHAAGIVDAVEGNSRDICEYEIQSRSESVAHVIFQLCSSVKDTHEDRKAHMAGDGKNGARKRDR